MKRANFMGILRSPHIGQMNINSDNQKNEKKKKRKKKKKKEKRPRHLRRLAVTQTYVKNH